MRATISTGHIAIKALSVQILSMMSFILRFNTIPKVTINVLMNVRGIVMHNDWLCNLGRL